MVRLKYLLIPLAPLLFPILLICIVVYGIIDMFFLGPYRMLCGTSVWEFDIPHPRHFLRKRGHS